MSSMKPSWKPFITEITEMRVITPTTIPVTERIEGARPLLFLFARKYRIAINRIQYSCVVV